MVKLRRFDGVMDYKVHVSNWLNGLYSEIEYWTVLIQTKGIGVGLTDEKWKRLTNPDKPFYFDDIIDRNGMSFADIGSGPFSRCGRITGKYKVDYVFVDPLGNIYEDIKNKCGVDNGNHITRGFVEFLDKQFKCNSFDIVHMSNALDHCFDPVFGIFQLLNICKIGGVVILRHAENEAVNENYFGLHQWNLSLKNDKNTFLIWNESKSIDVCDTFKEYADFKLEKDITERNGTWVYNQVVMTKKKDVVIPENNYLFDFVAATYDLYAQTQQDKLEYERQGAKKRIFNEIKSGLGRKLKH